MKTKLYRFVILLCSCIALVACEDEADRRTVKNGAPKAIEGYKVPLKVEDRFWTMSVYFSEKADEELSAYKQDLWAKLKARHPYMTSYDARVSYGFDELNVKSGYDRVSEAYIKRSETALSNLRTNMKEIISDQDSLAAVKWNMEYIDSYYFEKMVGTPRQISKLSRKSQGKMAEELVACIRDCNWVVVKEIKYDRFHKTWTLDCGSDGIWYAKKVKGEFLYGNMIGDDKNPAYDFRAYSQQLTLNFLTGSGMF